MKRWKADAVRNAEGNRNTAGETVTFWRFTVLQANRHHRAVRPGGAKMEQVEQEEVFAGPRTLPIVRHDANMYFADLRLKQFRDIDNPHNYVDFDSERGQHMCMQNGIITCFHCGTTAIISTALDMEKLRCVRCSGLIVPLFDV
jgi:hypothetical protein